MTSSPTASELTYLVSGMSCEHCRIAVTDEVGKVDGVAAVSVDLATKLVRIEGGADHGDLVAAIDDAGYDAVAA